MAKKRKTESSQKSIEQYEHKDKQRLNNPPVGLVDSRTDNDGLKKKTYHSTQMTCKTCLKMRNYRSC